MVTTFSDPAPPAPGYAPFGIANIDNFLFVTFALQNAAKHDDVSGQGNGFVDVFSSDTGFLKRLIPLTTNGPLDSPWGLARVPHEFGNSVTTSCSSGILETVRSMHLTSAMALFAARYCIGAISLWSLTVSGHYSFFMTTCISRPALLTSRTDYSG